MTLDDLRDRHHGATAYVMASGPSLRKVDPERIRTSGGVIITCNSSVMHAKRPDYHVVMDGAVPFLQSFQLVADSAAVVVTHHEVPLRKMIPRHRIVRTQIVRSGKLARDAGYLTQWTTTPVSSLHLAIILGCTRVYLLGCDCRLEDGKKYFYEFWDPPVDDPMVEEFVHTGFVRPERRVLGMDKEPEWNRAQIGGTLGAALADWKAAARSVPPGIVVINASSDRVKCFPYIEAKDINRVPESTL